jgi:hypothetical protein
VGGEAQGDARRYSAGATAIVGALLQRDEAARYTGRYGEVEGDMGRYWEM